METFNVGDEVIATVGCPGYYTGGAKGTVTHIIGDEFIWVKFHTGDYKTPFGSMGAWCTKRSQLRHVPPAPPAAPAVTSRAVVLTVEGVEYTAMFTLVNDCTGCALYWRKDNHEYALAGGTKRNPRDTYSADTGMRVAMRRACGIGRPYAHQLPAVYSAFRKWQHDQAALQSKQVKPLVVGAEVRAVKDSHDAPFFCKGASGVVIKVETVDDDDDQPYLVRWTSGPVKEGCGRGAETPKTWWAYADEIEAV